MSQARALIAALAIASGGCATVGGQFDPAQVERLERGVTTEAQAVALLGPPASRTVSSDGTVTLGYYYAKAETSPAMLIPVVGPLLAETKSTAHTAALIFGADGKLQSASTTQTDHRIGPMGTVQTKHASPDR